jgi:hypothetical protein
LTEKLDKLSNDILSLLRNIEPNRLRNHEIVDSLWKTYQSQYKDKKVFGVAVTQKLTLLKANRLIIHEDIWYGTPNSKPIAEKPSTEKPSKLGFFEFRNRKAEREHREQLLIHKENLLRAAQYCELLVKFYPEEMAAFGELAKNYREEMKEIDKVLGVASE